MLWRPFFARAKINYRSSNSHLLTRVRAVAMATGLVKKQGLNNGFCLFKKNPVVRLFSSFAHKELTLNPFYQHCSNNIL